MDLERIGSDWYWYDGEELHMDILRLLANSGLEDTEETREMAIDEVLALLRDMLRPALRFVIRVRALAAGPPGAPPGRESPGGGGGPET